MEGQLYSSSEVLWLLSLTYQDALSLDTEPAAQRLGASDGHADHDTAPLPLVVRWHDVTSARRRVVITRAMDQILAARVSGMTEHQTALATGTPRLAVHRSFHQMIDEILNDLNVNFPPHHRSSRAYIANACMRCARNPRARVRTTSRRPKGGWRTKPSQLCGDCLPASLKPRISPSRGWVDPRPVRKPRGGNRAKG